MYCMPFPCVNLPNTLLFDLPFQWSVFWCNDRHFEAVEARFLRASFSAFVDVLTLTTKTIEEFGKGMASWHVLVVTKFCRMFCNLSPLQNFFFFFFWQALVWGVIWSWRIIMLLSQYAQGIVLKKNLKILKQVVIRDIITGSTSPTAVIWCFLQPWFRHHCIIHPQHKHSNSKLILFCYA